MLWHRCNVAAESPGRNYLFMSDATPHGSVAGAADSDEHDFDEAVRLLNQLDRQLDALDAGLVSGPSPAATENRAIRGASARLAREHARELRARLARISERHIAVHAEHERPRGERRPDTSAREGLHWPR